MVASVVYGEWKLQPCQNLLNSVLSPVCLLVSLNAEVLVVVVVVGCVQAHDHMSPLSAATHTASLWHRMPVVDMKTIFKNLCYNTDQVCFVKTVSPAPVFARIPGSVLILGQVTQYGNPYLICIAFV